MSSNILIYGANGYTSELVNKLVVLEGATVIQVGCSEDKAHPFAMALNLNNNGEIEVFDSLSFLSSVDDVSSSH